MSTDALTSERGRDREVVERPAHPPFERTIVAAIAAVGVFQVVQGVRWFPHLSLYERSLWYVNYRYGFVRRGLPGEVLRQVLGHTPTRHEIDVVQFVIAALLILVIAVLVVVLCRHRNVIGYGLAGLIVASPFVFDTIWSERRPDLLAFVFLVVIAIWAAVSRVDAVVLGAVGGILIAAATFAGETAALLVGPWLVVVVAAAARVVSVSRARQVLAMALATLPWVLSLFVLLATGRASEATVLKLDRAAPPIFRGRGLATVFVFLGDNLSESVDRVAHHEGHIEFSIPVGVVLLALTLWCARGGLAQRVR